MEEFKDESILLKTIQPFNDSNNFSYKLPAPAYTSTEKNMLMNDGIKKNQNFKNSYGGATDSAELITRDEKETPKSKIPISKNLKSPYISHNIKGNQRVNPGIRKNGSAATIISSKKNGNESDTPHLSLKRGATDALDSGKDHPSIEKVRSQDHIVSDGSKPKKNKIKSKIQYTPDGINDRESRISSDRHGKEKLKHAKNIKSENVVKKAIKPSEFIMREGNDSPTRRMMENKNKRIKVNQSKVLHRNESQDQLSSNRKLNRNESQRSLEKDPAHGSSERGKDSAVSKKLIKNLREHIALKLYEHDVPANNYHRVSGKSSSISSNSYIQKMLNAYNIFNKPQNSYSQNKYSNKLRRNLRNQYETPKYKHSIEGRNRSLHDKKNSRQDPSPGYPKDKSVVLPKLSRSPGISLISSRKKSIMNMKKKHHNEYMKSLKRYKLKNTSLSKSNKSSDLGSIPSISKQLNRILNSHKLSGGKDSKNIHQR